MFEWLTAANDAMMTYATSFEGTPWLFVFLWLFITLDGILPIFPSESLVIGVVALSMSTGHPNIWIVFAIAIVGALGGDLTAYTIGRYLSVKDIRLLKVPRVARMMQWAERMVASRPAPVIISARYIPIGRVAVNFTAGQMRFPRRAFVFYAAIAAVTWAGYSSLIGMGAGTWLKGHPIVAVVAGVVGGVLLGYIVDFVVRRILRVGEKRGHDFGEGFEQLAEVAQHSNELRHREQHDDHKPLD
ncbi:DedA family protein [Timonella sp. A28]|uniref:DedA family protein n=1 Tax=Timonella sp. A28 TaxID=3442640 RepID=UPI003EBD1B1F